MQNATRPGFAAPTPPPPPQVPMMPMGYGAPQYPQYQPQPQVVGLPQAVGSAATKSVNSIASSIGISILKIGLPLLLVLWGVYFFFQTDTGKGLLEAAKWLIPIIEDIGVITAATYAYKFGARAGFLGKAKKAEQLAEDAKTAREAGDLEKAEKLEKEAADAKAEAEAAGEEVEGVTESGKLAKEGEQVAEAAEAGREAEQAAEAARGAGQVAEEAREAEATAQEVREAASFLRL